MHTLQAFSKIFLCIVLYFKLVLDAIRATKNIDIQKSEDDSCNNCKADLAVSEYRRSILWLSNIEIAICKDTYYQIDVL